MHPLDQKGKTPLNLEHGVFSNVGAKGSDTLVTPVEHGQKWETFKSAPRDAVTGALAASTPPTRVSRTALESKAGGSAASLGKNSSIAYDPVEHRFVNANSSANARDAVVENGRVAGAASAAAATQAGAAPPRTSVAPSAARSASSPPPSRSIAPPPAHYSGGASSSGSRAGGSWGGSGSASSSGSGSGRSSSAPSAPAASAPASHPTSSGRPH